jgi:hypothetical protein
MEMSQGNSLCSYLKQKHNFFIYKIGEQKGEAGFIFGGRVGTCRRGEDVGKGYTRVSIV